MQHFIKTGQSTALMTPPIITRKEAQQILLASETGKSKISISLDLGISKSEIEIKTGPKNKFAIINNQKLPLAEFEKLKEDTCYFIEKNSLKPVIIFSDETNFYYKLLPTTDWPTITFSSTPMHRHTLISPKEDSKRKVDAVSPIKGKVLDTCCGLGYTAIIASEKADDVIVFEHDENVIEIARLNPYSESLFDNKNTKIRLFQEDIALGISKQKDRYFDRIIHDPPTFKYASELYSKRFYQELFRVMKKGGILYHYCPNPGKMHGAEFHLRTLRDLKAVGFSDVKYDERSSGIIAKKN